MIIASVKKPLRANSGGGRRSRCTRLISHHGGSRMGRVVCSRRAAPEEIVDVVRWLGSDAASYVTSRSISVDGGFIMR